MANLFPSMAGAAIGAASKTASSQMQINLLEETKTLTESALQVCGSVRWSVGWDGGEVRGGSVRS